MSVSTRSQQLAEAAYRRIAAKGEPSKEFVSFAKRFPALLHTCGLAQAVAFALAKRETDYVEDLADVLRASGHPELTNSEQLDHHARTQSLGGYLRLSRNALSAAGWLKRYAEAAKEAD